MMTSSAVFTNLFDDDESDDLDIEDTYYDTDRVAAIPVLYSVGELFTMMADINTSAGVQGDDDHDDKKTSDTSGIEIPKPMKKLRPSRPLKHKNTAASAEAYLVENPAFIDEHANKVDNTSEYCEERNVMTEIPTTVVKGDLKEITLKMSSKYEKPDYVAEATDPQSFTKNHQATTVYKNRSLMISPVIVKKEKTGRDENGINRGRSGVQVTKQSVDKVPNIVKIEKQVTKVKTEPGIVKTERLSLPSTVRVTLVQEEDEIRILDDGSNEEDLSSKTNEKDGVIISQEQLIKELNIKNEEVNKNLALREEFIDSQQKVIDELEKQSINSHKVEKLSNDLEEKEKTVFGLREREVLWKSKLVESESSLKATEDYLTSTIAEKEAMIISQQNLIKELGGKIEEVDQKLIQREGFIDSQQKAIDDLENQSINTHKVEKLENDLEDKERTISELMESDAVLTTKLLESENNFKTQKIAMEGYKQQLLKVENDKFIQLNTNNQLTEKCSTLVKENKVLVEVGNSQRSTSEDIMKTVEALKGKIDNIMENDSIVEDNQVTITNLQNENSSLTQQKKILEDEVTSFKMSMFKKSEENALLEKTLKEKSDSTAQLVKEISKLSEKLKDMKKNLDGKVTKASKSDKENGKLKDKLKELEKDLDSRSKEGTSLQRKLDENLSRLSSAFDEQEKLKSLVKEIEERLDLEVEKSVDLIKKLNFSEKLIKARENDFLVLKDQQLLLQTEIKKFQNIVDEHEKDNLKLVDAHLRVNCLEDEKKDLMKEIRKVSELQKKIKFLEAKLKKYYSYYKKQTSVAEPVQEEPDPTSISPSLEVMDIPDPNEIDAILQQINQDVTKHTESVAAEVSVKEIPQTSVEQLKVGSAECLDSLDESWNSLHEEPDSKPSNTIVDEEDGLLTPWRTRLHQTQFSTSPASSIKESAASQYAPIPLSVNTSVTLTKPSVEKNEASEETVAAVDGDDIVVISSQEFKSNRKKKKVSSDSDWDTEEDDERRKRHKKKRSKKKKTAKSKRDEKERDRKRHRSRKEIESLSKSRSRTRSRSKNRKRVYTEAKRSRSRSAKNARSHSKSRSRTRSRSRNNRRKVHKTGRRSRSRSSPLHFREKIRNVSRSPEKRVKRLRSSSPKKPKDAKFALSKEISSIIEKLQGAKSETVSSELSTVGKAAPGNSQLEASKDETKSPVKSEEGVTKNPSSSQLKTNIVANYSSEFEEISDDEMTLAEDCSDEIVKPENTEEKINTEKKHLQENSGTNNKHPGENLVIENSIYGFGLLPVAEERSDEKMLQEQVELVNDAKTVTVDSVPVKVEPAEIEANPLTVSWNLNCSCCGAKLTGSITEDAQHYEEGECKKKSDWVKQGLPLICAYCTESGTHWVAACPLLASFCFTCHTWGHSMDTHQQVECEKTIARLLASYNRFRLNHHANSGRSEQYKVFPSNSKLEGEWKFTGSAEDVETVARKIPGHMGKPVGWLVKDNWVKLRGLAIKEEV